MFRKFFCFAQRSGERKRPEGKHSFLRGKLGGTAARRAAIKSRCPDFRQKKFEAPAQIPSGLYGINSAQAGGLWGGGVSAIPALAERQNRKIFVSLIEKNLGVRK